MRPSCVAVFSPAAMGSFSAASGGIRDASLPRNANASPACRPPPSSPLLPAAAAAAAAAAARASSKSRWTRLSLTETARLVSPPPLHFFFQLRKNSYSRKGAMGQPACPNLASFPHTNTALTNSRCAAPLRPSAVVYQLNVAIIAAYFLLPPLLFVFPPSLFLFLAAGPLPLLAPRSLAGAHSSCSLSDSPRSDL